MDVKYRELIDLLISVRDEKIDCETAEDEAEKLDWKNMPEVENVYGNLFHFWADADIRAKDSVYRQFQTVEFSKLIRHLEHGEYDRACDISFLHTS